MPRQADALARIRKAILYAGASEDELRQALGDLGGLDGLSSGSKVKALGNIRRSILQNL